MGIEKGFESDSNKIFVFYIPGLDRRRVTSKDTPFTYSLLTEYPSARIRTLPSTELVPALLTGTYPHQNRIFQVSRKSEPSWLPLFKILNFIPDAISVFWQCLYFIFNQRYELPTVPWYRRRQFNFHRFKYKRRQKNIGVLDFIGDIPSLFHFLNDSSRYIFAKEFKKMRRMIPSFPSADVAFEFFEFYALDLFSHWNLDRSKTFAKALNIVDNLIKALQNKCEEKGVTLIILVDHGQERIRGTINLKKMLSATDVPRDEYLFFMELATTRFWFKTDEARRTIMDMLQNLEHITILDYKQMDQYNICLDDEKFGEVFIFADHGYIFFPHDFYHPLTNIFLALSNNEQRSRLFNPCHRGNHGYLPGHPAEEGYVILMDKNYMTSSEWVELIDFAPSMLSLLGRAIPEYMRGKKIFIPNEG